MKENTKTEQPEETTEQTKETVVPPEEITDYYARKWYKEGFRFAVNYLHAILPDTNPRKFLTKADFAQFLDDVLNEGIDPDYFRKHPFNASIGYPVGQCPGDVPGTCIQCADRAIAPLP